MLGTQKNLSPLRTVNGMQPHSLGFLTRPATSVGGKKGIKAGKQGGLDFLKHFQCHLSAFCGKPRSLEGLLRPGCIS